MNHKEIKTFSFKILYFYLINNFAKLDFIEGITNT